ncbi:MAG: nucleotidyltransferase domain-containing protein [Candidatus Peribacteraceae bacterium]|nr:nucleotidyltransferase domain-containing protein [Candidatus Peribacteraceae bacterium]
MSLSHTEVLGIIRNYIALVRAAGVPVSEVRLFGSRARGKEHDWSDIDLCVVSSSFGKDYSEEMSLLLTLTMKMDSPVPIEPIPFAPKDLNEKYSTLASEIRKYGKKVAV